ncbi:MAG: DNA polymerase III subunit gamma/tau [Acidiferrobacteraceae bacterium]|nr:DNA polymerase III subunit gamma/tau [Acidiferrobacteraceae bacterium]
MSYQALARKWRPRRFADVVGQDHVVNALRNALEQNRVHHAFLFSGTRGVGKTTLARLLAKALNCEQGQQPEPCGECGTCQSVDEGRFIDLIEIDAASRTRVDDTREILDNVQYAPTQGRYKIYLIDEVHMLSGHSFNALLKTLEEPPPHVKFLLATTDPQKLPATILSRCLQFNLRLLTAQEIGGHLEQIVRSEDLGFDGTGLEILSRAADGSMRDGLSLLDQSIAFGDGSVTGSEVRDMLGMIESHHVDAILLALAAKDGNQLLDTVASMTERPVDYMSALDELLVVLHNVSLFQVLPEAAAAKQTDSDLVRQLASSLGKEDVQLYYQIGLLGKRDLPLAPDPASGFEMTLLRMLTFCPDGESDVSADSDRLKAKPSGSSNVPRKAAAKDTSPAQHASAAAAQAALSEARTVPSGPLPNRGVSAPALSDPAVWAAFVEDSGFTGVTRELAMNLCPESYDAQGGVLTLSLIPGLASMRSPSRQKSLEKKLEVFCGVSVRLEIAEGGEVSGETPAMAQQRREQEEKEQAYKTLMDDPAVQSLVSAFDATVVPDSVTPGKQQRKSE